MDEDDDDCEILKKRKGNKRKAEVIDVDDKIIKEVKKPKAPPGPKPPKAEVGGAGSLKCKKLVSLILGIWLMFMHQNYFSNEPRCFDMLSCINTFSSKHLVLEEK